MKIKPTTIFDLSGSENHLKFNGGVIFVSDANEFNYFEFDGSSDYLSLLTPTINLITIQMLTVTTLFI